MSTAIENFNIVAGTNIDDTLFTPTQIEAAQAVIQQYLEDTYTDLDFSALSSLYDLNVRPTAQVFLVLQQLIEQFNATNTLSKVAANPAASSSAIVDALLSNFSISRLGGVDASGYIKVIFNGNPTSASIPATCVFSTVDGLNFTPTGSFVAVPNPTLSGQVALYYDAGNTQSYAIIPATASVAGSQYNIPQYTQLTAAPAPNGFVSANAFSSFTGGTNTESDQAVIARLIPALSARNLASPLAIQQTLMDKFPNIQQLSVQGINGPLMTRNSHNIFGIKSGCCCDVYVKTSSSVEQYSVNKVAQKIVLNDPATSAFQDYVGKYVVYVTPSDVPGFYGVASVTPQINGVIGSYVILDTVRGFSTLSPSGSVPNSITTVTEGFYSSYGCQYVVFDPITDPNPSGTSIPVTVVVNALPQIADIQNFVNASGSQTALVDTLVKAFVPCYVSTSEITVRVLGTSVTGVQLQNVVSNYINCINPATAQVRADGIVAVLLGIPSVLSVDLPITITANICAPDANATEVQVTTQSVLNIPQNVALGYSNENIAFFSQASGIPIMVINS